MLIYMDKEKPIFHTDGGYSEKQIDLAVDKAANNDQVKAGNIFDPQKIKKKPKNDLLTESK